VGLVKVIGLGLLLLGAGAAGIAYWSYRRGAAEASAAWADIASRARPPLGRFDLLMVEDEPEIARRYFAHAIAPGTPLHTAVELEMRGTFLLGNKEKHRRYTMAARQILRPPFEFVWQPTLRSGAMVITGSDALVGDRAWTRFWLLSLIPVANVATSTDVLRSAAFRAASESLWAPATLLPQNGGQWEQIGPNRARVTTTRSIPAIVLELELGEDGAVKEVIGLRWSNANADARFRFQPFGGTVQAERSFGGFTIPSQLHVGNHYGTLDYLPFFQAEITNARYF